MHLCLDDTGRAPTPARPATGSVFGFERERRADPDALAAVPPGELVRIPVVLLLAGFEAPTISNSFPVRALPFTPAGH